MKEGLTTKASTGRFMKVTAIIIVLVMLLSLVMILAQTLTGGK